MTLEKIVSVRNGSVISKLFSASVIGSFELWRKSEFANNVDEDDPVVSNRIWADF